jgi:CopG family transcriptional regulator/antitoxin EndoAI
MRHRINITLPQETVQLIDRVAERGDRSRFIDEAVRDYVSRRSRQHLKKRLQEGASKRAERDLDLAQEWFLLDEEAWRRPPR